MLTSILLAATLGLSASPAAYDNALAHESYQITITSTSATPETVTPRLVPDINCSLALQRRPTWATMTAPASFTLAPGASRSFVVSVGEPPPGKSELVATFVASDLSPSGTGVSSSAGVGTALRFSEPGKTVITPCPQPKASHNPNVRTIVVGASNIHPASNTGLIFAIGGLTAVILLLVLAFGFLRFKRPRGSHR